MSIELWSIDLFDRDSPPHLDGTFTSELAGLEALWRAVLLEGVQDDGRPSFTDFTLRTTRGRVSLPRDPLQNPELAVLRARRHEPRFFQRLAALHASGEGFSFAPFLAMPVELPSAVQRVIDVLTGAMSSPAALVATRAGWATAALLVSCTGREWTVRAKTVRFEVWLDGEALTRRVVSDGSPAAQTLQDALTAVGLG
ncbi:MAG: hypothetical protein ACOZQL_06135 [Myxococcota bacterium]